MYTLLSVQDDSRSGIMSKLYKLLIKILKFVEKNIEVCTKQGAMNHLLNNKLFKEMIDMINYDDSDAKYNQ